MNAKKTGPEKVSFLEGDLGSWAQDMETLHRVAFMLDCAEEAKVKVENREAQIAKLEQRLASARAELQVELINLGRTEDAASHAVTEVTEAVSVATNCPLRPMFAACRYGSFANLRELLGSIDRTYAMPTEFKEILRDLKAEAEAE